MLSILFLFYLLFYYYLNVLFQTYGIKLKYTICAKQNGGCKNIIVTMNIKLNMFIFIILANIILALYQKPFLVGFLLLLTILHVLRYLFVLYLSHLRF